MAPWDKKLEGLDPETRAVVDELLRSDIQPYITQLEQKTSDLQLAEELYNDLRTNPAETYVQITNDLFGDEAADKVIAALDSGEDPREAIEEAAEEHAALTREQQEAIEWAQEQKRSTAYQQELSALKQRHAEDEDFVDIKDDLFSPFVSITGGDMEAAYAGYKKFTGDFKSEFVPNVNTEALENLDPPPTIGSEAGGGAAVTQTQPSFRGFDDAIDSLVADLKNAPPTIGHV